MLRTLLALAVLVPVAAARAQSAGASFIVVHGIPGRDVAPTLDPLLPVDVQVNGVLCLLHDFTFGSIAGPFDVPAGTYQVAISLANPLVPCSNSPVISGSATLAAGQFGAVVAALGKSGPTADVFAINVNPVDKNSQRIVALHAADAPTATITAKSTGGGATETATLKVQPGRDHGGEVPTRSGFAIKASAGGATVGPFDVNAGNQSVILGIAVGSLKSGSLTVLSKVIPSVF